jgi:hypothetical protein
VDKKNLGFLIEKEFKKDNNEFVLKHQKGDDKHDNWWTGSFKFKEKIVTIFSYEGETIMMVKLTYSSEIKAENKKEIDLYKIANTVNDRCPGIKCILDDYKKNKAFVSFQIEQVSNTPIDNLMYLNKLLDVLLLGTYYFEDELSRNKR